MARPGFNINQFKAHVEKNGFQRNNKFLVRIPIPIIFTSFVELPELSETARVFEYWCDAARMPGVALSVHPVLRYGYGVTERKPFSPIFTDVTFSFMLDGKGAIHTYFNEWINAINPYAFTSINRSNLDFPPYQLSYKYEYAVDLNVITFNDAGEETNSIILREAFPIYLGEVNTNWMDPNISRIPVTFTYMDWQKVV